MGGLFAFLLYGLMVVALPLCLDMEVDFVSAMLLSLKVVARNKAAMGLWAVIIATISIAGLVPLFLGLFVALPVLGHASWHLYRRALYLPR